jgi:hypothetical protein
VCSESEQATRHGLSSSLLESSTIETHLLSVFGDRVSPDTACRQAEWQKENHSKSPYGVTNRIRICCSTRRSIPCALCEFAERHYLPGAGLQCFRNAEIVYTPQSSRTEIHTVSNNNADGDNQSAQWLNPVCRHARRLRTSPVITSVAEVVRLQSELSRVRLPQELISGPFLSGTFQ